MIFLTLWLLGATFTFFWSYPGGMDELKRDWKYHKGNLAIYAGGMVLVWFLILPWMLKRKNRESLKAAGPMPNLKEVR